MRGATETGEILALLGRHGVEFIVVGMTAAVLQGAPAVTFDLDIVYSRRPPNVRQLMSALAELEAVFRGDERRLAPNESHLVSSGHKLLDTKFGDFDVLGSLGAAGEELDYDDLLASTVTLELRGQAVRVLGLERLIEVKDRAGRAKDRAVLPLLRATLQRSRQ